MGVHEPAAQRAGRVLRRGRGRTLLWRSLAGLGQHRQHVVGAAGRLGQRLPGDGEVRPAHRGEILVRRGGRPQPGHRAAPADACRSARSQAAR
jgi:hypothetical protein